MPELTPRIGLKRPVGTDNVTRAAYAENLDIIDASVVRPQDVPGVEVTIDPIQVPTGNTGTVGQLLGWLANRIRAITGAANWWSAPPVTLKAINDKFDGDSGHKHTGEVGDGPRIIPYGVIVMWSGEVATIPQGWALCNGANGTPDLRDRFIVGAGSKYAVGNKGGADSVTLTVNQIPAHTHTIGSFQKMDWGTHNNTDQLTPGTSSKSASTGGGQAHENRPPYYALCFIMKL